MITPRLTSFAAILLAVPCLLWTAPATPPTRLTLQQAGSRTGRDHVPANEGKEVIITGQVSARPIWITDSYYVAIQDDAFFGLVLQPDIAQLPTFVPGDWVEAQGIISKRAGLPILVPRTVRRLRHLPAPAPKVVTPRIWRRSATWVCWLAWKALSRVRTKTAAGTCF